MIQRCHNERAINFAYYGGRGIRVCDRWRSFDNFLSDMGARPEGLKLDRIDNNGNYEPGNCRWVTHKVQSRNRRSNHLITYQGETKIVRDWAEVLCMPVTTLHQRLTAGRSLEDVFTTPVKPHEHLLTFDGETLSISAWSRRTGLKRETIRARLKRGLTMKAVLSKRSVA